MSRIAIFAASALCATALAAAPVQADSWNMSGFGGNIGYASPEDLDGTMQFGAHLEIESPGNRFHIVPSLLYWSEDRISNLNPNLDVYYHFNAQSMVTPYLGGGLGIHLLNDDRADEGDTNLGANLFGGVRFPMSSAHSFVEARYAISDLSQFSVMGGVTFHR